MIPSDRVLLLTILGKSINSRDSPFLGKLVLVCDSGNRDPGQCIELTEREFSVCTVIYHSQQPVSFTQLRKSTELHQEVLSRIVRRLLVHGAIRRVESGKYEKRLSGCEGECAPGASREQIQTA